LKTIAVRISVRVIDSFARTGARPLTCHAVRRSFGHRAEGRRPSHGHFPADGEQVRLASAIDLGVGRITDSPAPAEGGITWRKAMTLSLTVDHRGVDGAPAARFLAGAADRLQAPAALL
jgi:hypothetical protein